MERVILESPFAPKLAETFATEEERKAAFARELDFNIRYARAAMRDCLKNHGEAPSASHLLYTQDGVLDDTDPEERTLGIDAGLEWRKATTKSVVYLNRQVSGGMRYGIDKAKKDGNKIVGRFLPSSLMAELGIPEVAIDPKDLAALGIEIEGALSAAA
jgi:hypothetical protein